MTETQKDSSLIKLLFTIIGLLVIIILILLGWKISKIELLGIELAPPATASLEIATSQILQPPLSLQTEQPPIVSTQPAMVTEPIPIIVSVSATKGWQGTGIIINAGDNVKIRYREGSWLSVKGETFFGPDPTFAYETLDKCFPLPKAPGALIGMIGNYEPFKIGYSYETTSNVHGELFMRMNDCDQWLDDNKDELENGIRVIISIVKP